MTDFKIRRGLSSVLFPEHGVVNPRLVIEEGCWYLCTDTAELYLGTRDENDELVLKRINDKEDEPSFGPAHGTVESDKFIRISSEDELPVYFEAEDFNPNTAYYLPGLDEDGNDNGSIKLFIFDEDTQCFLCTSTGTDELLIRELVDQAINNNIDVTVMAKVPEVVKQTLEATILYGGDATPED